ncbi:helix-turn-helix domain-containing protein [Streptomyces thermodiastaticus]
MAGREHGATAVQEQDRRQTSWAEELLSHLRPAGQDVRRVVSWLADAVQGTACLLDGTGARLAGRSLPLNEQLLAYVGSGRLASAALQDGGRHLRVVRVGGPHSPPLAVLVVARTAPFDAEAAEMVTHTATVVGLLLRARQTQETGHRLRQATSALRLAILQLLMVEDTVSARRVAAGLWPGLLDTDTVHLYVVQTRPEDRERLAEECLELVGEQALVVRCPAEDGHVIVLAPAEATCRALRSYVAARPGTWLGGSTRQSLARTSTAYGQAVSALALARCHPDGTALYAERTHPERLMDRGALHAWSARLLRPLDVLPHHVRAELIGTTRLGLEFTAVRAARILGVSRNTVRARMDRTACLLGADLSRLSVRAAVHLALNTQAGRDTSAAAEPAVPPGGTVRLRDLLTEPALRTWAQELLGRLSAEPRKNLRGTLRAWIAADGNAERAAQQLGVHAQTVRGHLRGVEPVLQRRVLATGSDLYEVVLAHLAAGDLDAPTVDADE